MKAAGIPYTDHDGKDYDFHALRHQFITELSRAGVSLKSAQELARHSKPELTANVYTHLTLRDSAADVEKMGSIPTGELHQETMTGTDPVLGQQLGQQVLESRGVLGHKRKNAQQAKTQKKPGKNRALLRVTEGIRTPDPWNHNPVL